MRRWDPLRRGARRRCCGLPGNRPLAHPRRRTGPSGPESSPRRAPRSQMSGTVSPASMRASTSGARSWQTGAGAGAAGRDFVGWGRLHSSSRASWIAQSVIPTIGSAHMTTTTASAKQPILSTAETQAGDPSVRCAGTSRRSGAGGDSTIWASALPRAAPAARGSRTGPRPGLAKAGGPRPAPDEGACEG